MSLFRVVEVLSTENTDGGMLYRGRVLEDNLIHRKADSLYLSYQGRRKGPRALEGTPMVISQNSKCFIEEDYE